ncbi:sel1 repeat family protein [Pseudomonas typographi]|uniref:Sel1 repeat family protein n=1 Tax=Pseudomonas typographi TaxID=2715964 RepID=A0ABR7YX88_9PSED|nr:sel1 repeat family protein [Pseudomonas typographi]MBD1551184.1 sel1 repeat family protein [Pseudomonas typographi]MBD1586322.1 sel1 repeat family protein [Pseudomonas typographi]MBD1597794.1 sel1 repeat family protein [Pseudomonas typographi]
MEHGISLEMAELLTGCSRRTWWRRVQQGRVQRLPGNDARGRARLALPAILPLLRISVSDQDRALILAADRGEAQALNELGQLFALGEQWAVAEQLWLEASRQGQADAMQHLAMLYLGSRHDGARALMWLARAASAGHAIARAQLRGLWPGLRMPP